MTTSLSSRQGLLTRSVNRLAAVVDEHRDLETWALEPPSEDHERRTYLRAERLRIRKVKAILDTETSNVDTALERYSTAADSLDADTPSLNEILEKVSSNIERASATLDKGRVVQTAVARLLGELDEIEKSSTTGGTASSPDLPQLKLAPIPIPKFSGRVWEWDTFWTAFEHSVDSREMDDIYKMNYLLDALHGEAKDTIKQYEVSGRTYPLVVARLKEKYGNSRILIDQLIRRLQQARAHSNRLEHQEKLWEELSSIVAQLQLKGENVDNSFLQNQLLGKFAEGVQRHVLRMKENQTTDVTWNTNTLLDCARNYISTELQIVNQMGNKHDQQLDRNSIAVKKNTFTGKRINSALERLNPCFYCGKVDHNPKDCREVATREQRLTFMRKKNLCLNCGAKDHWAVQCKGGSCRMCRQRGHHTSLCEQLPSRKTTVFQETRKPLPVANKGTSKRPMQKSATSPKVNVVLSEADKSQDEVSAFVNIHRGSNDVHILVGEAQVMNPKNQALEPIHVLLDTGADRSFISSELADHLQLQDLKLIELSINTFGSNQPLKQTCGITQLQLWDKSGTSHRIEVTKIDTVTEPMVRQSLDLKDKQFLFDKNIHLSITSHATEIKPQVLLGCSDLYAFLDEGFAARITLPSGLTLIPSKLGYLVSGCPSRDDKDEEIPSQPVVNSVSSRFNGDLQSWEEFCTFEATGVHEFTGPSVEERKRMDAEIWKRFERTIESTEDGYQVRFPWKQDAITLPDNKALAVKRLQGTIAKFADDEESLQQYNGIIMNQLEQGIIEEVNEETPSEGSIVHYLAHHAVKTPTKATTKLRIVFDASAHLKGQPSLNDVLYPGPVILPKICDILLRFRIGRVAIISDVEKAFLQIRLHPKDRDATRFLWLRDIAQPLTPANMITYRFTRVTFGLNCSPFLLAGTIKHHLETRMKNSQLGKEIASNTYVDNVIVTTSSTEDAMRLYVDSKQLFRDLNMNLREYRSNDETLNRHISSTDLSTNVVQKVLGVSWNTQEDQILLKCQYRPTPAVPTKRSVSEQVASIYDPLGLLTPLTLRGKQFLQQLWAHDYGWDTPLTAEHRQTWCQILEDASGYQIALPRRVAHIDSESVLAVFSDASANGMSVCSYLVSEDGSYLLAGKSKLPSLKENPTIPKLELNAITMATRLAYSIHSAICERVNIVQVCIFSDSEIALSWVKAPTLEKSAGVLVRNRRAEIRRIVAEFPTPVLFGFVPSTKNPADCGTRGLTKTEFEGHMWWRGPEFLQYPLSPPEECRLSTFPPESTEEETCVVAVTTKSTTELVDWGRQSYLPSVKRTLAYALRFIRQLSLKLNEELRHRLESNIPELCYMSSEPYITATENEMALRVLVRHHQRIHFTPSQLKSLKQLNVRPDEAGILRCQGRFGKAHMSLDTKNPMLVASKTELSRAIVKEAHLPYHCSTAQTIANVRQQFWIPKIRQMVKQFTRLCIPCQRLNNLPFKYPDMEDLPERRVIRTRPFEHVGIDYFGPLSAKQNDTPIKVYGIIITCTVTRLLHLELVLDMSTEQLLHALRRFFARRGVPASITSDNGPSFLLGEQVLHDAVFPVINDVSFSTAMATKGILWRTITPYAPWQGAFYERLIKSVKHSLYKVIKREVVHVETLETLLIEVEGTLNSRPLTYQEEHWQDTPILRPIDFIQRDMIIAYPLESITGDFDDTEYHPTKEAVQLRTRRQAEEALKSSHELTERFWKMWNEHYLRSLRETHKLSIDNKRGSALSPAIGNVVLIADPLMPRNSWRLGRIRELPRSETGTIREALLNLPSGRVVRRPINHLIPLELEDSPDQSSSYDGDVRQHDRSSNETEEQKEEAPRYDLRPRKHMNYYEVTTQGSQIYSANTKRVPLKFFITCLTIFMLMQQAAATLAQGKMQCISGGVMITTQNIERYELCAEGHCHVSEHPQGNETILLPPEVLLHEHHVQLKLFDGYNLTVLETTCLPVSFCEHVRCWFCTANMFNPECSPRTAIASTAVTLYIVIALLYVLCYVPMVVGKPCRIVCKTAWIVFTAIARLLWNQCNKFRRNRRRRYDVEALLKAPLLAIACIAVFAPSTLACQDIDVFSHQHSVCSFSPNGYKRCMLETTIIAKLNSFNKEACIRLINKQTVEKELRIQWKHLRLNCVKDNIVFTRNTIQRVVDSKRCPHSGSCTNDKCASVNTSAHIAELEHGNRYPGLTFCVESCGGPGCGCFYLSSGCLFYRIFHIPTDSKIYEIFKCPQWQEEVELEITTVSRQKSVEKKVVVVHPTVPTNTDNMRITLSALAVPPTPALSSTFISDGSHLATWNHKDKPHLQCGSEMDARSLNCSVTTSCNCEPAENKINCLCVDANITEIFIRDIETRFPIHRPWITFTPSKTNRASVTAEIPSFTTAEFVIHLTDHVDKTVTMVTDSVCTIPNSIAQGCYNCPQGATAQVTCTTDGNDTMATVQCGDLFFTIPCNRKGAISTLRFSHASARVKKECKVSCGKSETIFEITGILQWIRTIHGSTLKILAGESSVYDELVFPDFGHIIDVFLSWYKTLLIACVVLILASVIGYVFLWSCGINIIQRVLRVSWIIVRKIVKIPLWMLKTAWRSAAFIPRQSTKGSEKLL